LKISAPNILKLLAIVLAFSTLGNSTFSAINRKQLAKETKFNKKQDPKQSEQPAPQTWLLVDHGKVADLSTNATWDLLTVNNSNYLVSKNNQFTFFTQTTKALFDVVLGWRTVLFEHVAAPNAP
jgi:hypothetical protein